MILIISAVVIVILTFLLGIRRSNKRDLFHLLAVVISAAAAYFLTVKFADKLYAFTENRFALDTEDLPLFRQMMTAAARPAVIMAAFIVLFIVLGLVFHFIARDRKKAGTVKKPNIFLKILLNLISSVIIAAVFIIPVDYYAKNAGRIVGVLDSYDMELDMELPDLQKFTLGTDIVKPATDMITRVEFDGQTYSFDKCAACAAQFSDAVGRTGDSESVKELIASVQADEQAERLCGALSSELFDRVQDPKLRTVLKLEGRISGKLRAYTELPLLRDMMEGKIDAFAALKTLMEHAEKDECAALATLCTFEELKSVNYKGAYNAPLIAEIIRCMSDLPDKSPEGIGREAESVAYLLNIDPDDSQSCFNYNDLDPDLVAKCIHDSYLLQNGYINVTDHGAVEDPCGVAHWVYHFYSSTILYRLDERYGFGPDSDLYKSLLAFFKIKEI